MPKATCTHRMSSFAPRFLCCGFMILASCLPEYPQGKQLPIDPQKLLKPLSQHDESRPILFSISFKEDSKVNEASWAVTGEARYALLPAWELQGPTPGSAEDFYKERGGFLGLKPGEILQFYVKEFKSQGGGVLGGEKYSWSETVKDGVQQINQCGSISTYRDPYADIHDATFRRTENGAILSFGWKLNTYCDFGASAVSLGFSDEEARRLLVFQLTNNDLRKFGQIRKTISGTIRGEESDPSYPVNVSATLTSDVAPQTDVDAVFSAAGLDNWLPKAGVAEDKPGNQITVKARVYKKDKPEEQSPQKARFQFKLASVSREKGVCLNAPLRASLLDLPDLKIAADSNPNLDVAADGQSAITKNPDYDASVVITSYDWGGWGMLQVTAFPENGDPVLAHQEGQESTYTLSIPKDENKNHIADAWEQSNMLDNSAADGDEDDLPEGDGHPGDGLTNYEEYRGFMVKGVHIRTRPCYKDLFIWDPSKMGLGYFNESRIATHLVDSREWDTVNGSTNPRGINFNRGYASTGDQHLLYLKDENMPGLYGYADGDGPPSVPKYTHTVKINVAKCMRVSGRRLMKTIAHELSHACNVYHHGDIDYQIAKWWVRKDDGSIEEWTVTNPDAKASVSAKGGQESGVEQCIMRYNEGGFYENPVGKIEWLKPGGIRQRGDEYSPFELPGTFFCDSPAGTGVNAPSGFKGVSKAGNASKGSCKAQFCVNDMRH